MVAVPESRFSLPEVPRVTGGVVVPVRDRRIVAVTVGAVELLRPGSDLLRLVEGAGHVDVLIATEDTPIDAQAPLGVLAGCEVDDPEWDEFEESDDHAVDEFAALDLPAVHLHRLGLRAPLGPQSADDLVAALSELVGFDPEPGVYLLGPAVAPGDAGRAVVDLAVQRVARVYGIPLLRFRRHELTVVTDPAG